MYVNLIEMKTSHKTTNYGMLSKLKSKQVPGLNISLALASLQTIWA